MIIASHVRHALNIIGLGTFIIGLGIFFPIIAPRFGLTLGISKDPEIIFYPPPPFSWSGGLTLTCTSVLYLVSSVQSVTFFPSLKM